MLKGGNSQLLAEAASARIKLRASVKRNENNSPSKIENEKQTSSEKTPNEKPAWMAALNKVCIVSKCMYCVINDMIT